MLVLIKKNFLLKKDNSIGRDIYYLQEHVHYNGIKRESVAEGCNTTNPPKAPSGRQQSNNKNHSALGPALKLQNRSLSQRFS